ncbi:MAG: glycosyltransferase family 4 protein [Candidatus Riflebacteria bacterium]|nr:glycosyltransferase family 4 protein [Candidatus Riflebacteria bacterium]
MRIVYVTHGKDLFPQIRAEYFLSKNHEVHFIGIPPHIQNGIIENKSLKYIEIQKRYNFPFFFDPEVGMQIRKITRDIQPDIVHIFGTYFGYISFFVHSKKVVIENNGSDVLLTPKKHWMAKLYYFPVFRYADGVIQDSEISRKASYRCGARRTDNLVIPLGINTDIFNDKVEKGVFRKKYNISDQVPLIFSPRSLKPLYNFSDIIHSLAILSEKGKDFIGIFAGYASENYQEAISLVKKFGLNDKIIFIPHLSQKELSYVYADSSVVVSVPSSDSLPSSVIEAMACKTPVIVSELPWYKGIFQPGNDIFSVKVNDIKQLSRIILNVIEKRLILNYSEIFRQVERCYSIENCGKRLEQFYLNILNRN